MENNNEEKEEEENHELFNDTASSMIRNMYNPVAKKIIEDMRKTLLPYENIANSLNKISKVPEFNNLGMFTQLIESQRKMLEPLRIHSQLFDSLQKSTSWQKNFGLNESYLKAITGFDSNINSQFAKNISAINIGWGLIDNGFASKISDSLLKGKLIATFQNLSSSYIGVAKLFDHESKNIFSLPEYLSLGVTKEYAVASQSYVVVSEVDEESEEYNFYNSVEEEAFNEVGDAILSILSNYNANLKNLWIGAQQALQSKNPEKIRHASISLRELLTHLIHQLSPDDKIKEWTQDPKLFSDTRPTRTARLKYILREINIPQLNDFIEKDIKACVELMNALNAGTHSIESKLNEKHLKVLLIRVGSFIQYLSEVIKN